MYTNDLIEKCLANNDVDGLRQAIGSICYTSRDFSSGEFDEAVSYVKSKEKRLMEEFNSSPELISKTKDNFTQEDFGDAVFELKSNFCEERIWDVKTIGKFLSKNISVIGTTRKSDVNSYERTLERTFPNKSSRHSQRVKRIPLIAGVTMVAVLTIVFLFLQNK